MRARRLIVPAVAVLAFCCSLSQAKAKIDTTVYEVKLMSPLGDMGTRKMYKKGDNFVWELESAELKFKFIKNKDGAFMTHPFGRFIGKYPAGTNRESPMTFLPGPVGDVKEFLDKVKATKDGSETIGKKDCDIYAYTEPETGWKCRLWVEQKTFGPVKMAMAGKAKANTVDVTYVSYKTGVVIAESRFKLPEGVSIRPMPEDKKDAGAGTLSSGEAKPVEESAAKADGQEPAK